MFIIAVKDREEAGAYCVTNEYGDQILYMFEEEDDATRFAMMLEIDRGYPPMRVIEIEDEDILHACKEHGYEYSVFTPFDFVIPPEENDPI